MGYIYWQSRKFMKKGKGKGIGIEVLILRRAGNIDQEIYTRRYNCDRRVYIRIPTLRSTRQYLRYCDQPGYRINWELDSQNHPPS